MTDKPDAPSGLTDEEREIAEAWSKSPALLIADVAAKRLAQVALRLDADLRAEKRLNALAVFALSC